MKKNKFIPPSKALSKLLGLGLRVYSWKKEMAQYLLLGIPTIILTAYVLKMANQYFAFLENNWLRQSADFAVGLLLTIFLFARRFRFATLTAIFIVSALVVYKFLGSVYSGEFDAFFWSVKFLNHVILFFCGWVVGYGLSRARFFSIFWSVWLIAAMTVVVSRIAEIRTDTIILMFAPILFYSFFIIYISELIRNMNEKEPNFGWFVMKRFAGFALVMVLLLIGSISIFKHEFEAVEKEWGGGGKPKESEQGNSTLTRNDGQGTTTNSNMGLDGLNNKPNKDSVLFVAKLDNYFPDGVTPNPLYFTTDFYSKFDTETQTFEIDTLRPSNDLFSPDVSQIPLFFTKQDTSVIRKSLGDRNRKIVTAEVYKKNLSPRLYTAPSTGFFVQPISIPDENKYIYKSAYRAKMYISELNSAYFVYNPAGNLDLMRFQQQRFDMLRSASDYKTAPNNFLAYYTFIPLGNEFDSIRVLAKQIATKYKAIKPADQIIAIRDYFVEKDENNQPTFKYSDNPGVPGIPSANKLTYFLFQNKKGYCAYYAGATLFLFRALGIPSRIATGFLTVDRSTKNPGWYWYYEDQAHAWVQAWFPEYGWIDFDTTVPSEDQQQAPQPDQTPPLTSQTAWLVATGKATAIDTIRKIATMTVDRMLYWDKPFEFKLPQPLEMEVKLAKISRDSGQVPLSQLKPGDDIVSVSYSEQFKQIPPRSTDSALSIYHKFPVPAPIDEIKIMTAEEEVKKEKPKKKAAPPTNWQKVFLVMLGLVLLVVFIILAIPSLIFQYLHSRALASKYTNQKAYQQFLAAMYYLNQMGFNRGADSALHFAKNKIDPIFNTGFEKFMHAYQKAKYSKMPMSESESKNLLDFYPAFYYTVKKQLPWKYRFKHWLNFYKPIQFFSHPKIT